MPLKIEAELHAGPDMYDPMRDRIVLVGKCRKDPGGIAFGSAVEFKDDYSADDIQSAWEMICEAIRKRYES